MRRAITVLAASLLVLVPALTGRLAVSAQRYSFEEVVRGLHSPDARVRADSLRLLRESGYAEGAVPIAALLTDPEDAIRRQAVAAELEIFTGQKLPSRRRVAGFIEVRADNQAERAFLSGAQPNGAVAPAILDALVAAMRGSSPRTRLEAAYAFGVLAPADANRLPKEAREAAIEGLTFLITSREPVERAAGARVMGALVEGCGAACMPSNPARLGDALVVMLNDPNEGLRAVSMQALGYLRYVNAVQALTDLVNYHQRGPLAEASLAALSRIAHPSSVALFRSMVTAKDAGLRRYAVEGLARAGTPAMANEIESGFGAERDRAVGLAVAFAMQKWGRPGALERLSEAMRTKETRGQAADYLVELGPAGQKTLQALANDPDPQVANAARRALARLTVIAP